MNSSGFYAENTSFFELMRTCGNRGASDSAGVKLMRPSVSQRCFCTDSERERPGGELSPSATAGTERLEPSRGRGGAEQWRGTGVGEG